jgi:hypothetical protein
MPLRRRSHTDIGAVSLDVVLLAAAPEATVGVSA